MVGAPALHEGRVLRHALQREHASALAPPAQGVIYQGVRARADTGVRARADLRPVGGGVVSTYIHQMPVTVLKKWYLLLRALRRQQILKGLHTYGAEELTPLTRLLLEGSSPKARPPNHMLHAGMS